MTNGEIAHALGCSTHAVEILVSKALAKIEKAGDMEAFTTIVRLSQVRRGDAYIRCGSIECRPEKWVFYGIPTR